MGKTESKMESLEQDFAQIVREHKATIYTVCYMFSKNEEEVADLFRTFLSIFGMDLGSSAETAVPEPGFTVSA